MPRRKNKGQAFEDDDVICPTIMHQLGQLCMMEEQEQASQFDETWKCAINMLSGKYPPSCYEYCNYGSHSACLKICTDLVTKCPGVVTFIQNSPMNIEGACMVASEALKQAQKTEEAAEKSNARIERIQADTVFQYL